jgi:DNA-binding CsgD family transcriptional regulator
LQVLSAPYGQTAAGVPNTGRPAPFVGYENFLERLRLRMGPAIFVFGEPGIGKSRLLAEARACSNDSPVFHVTCLPAAQTLGLEPILHLVTRLHKAGRITHNALRKFVEAPERDRLIRGRDVLESAIDHDRLLIQFDDLQWADRQTLEALRYYVDRLQDLRVCWHFASRIGAGEVEQVASALNAGSLAEIHTLQGLELEALGRLVGALGSEFADPLMLERLRAQTAGNPFYVELLLSNGAFLRGEIPSTLRTALHHRLSAVSPSAAAILNWIAVNDGAADCDQLIALTGLSSDVVFASVREAANAGILALVGARYEFRHALLHEACLESMGEIARIAHHKRLANYSEDDAQRLRHLLGGKQNLEAVVLQLQMGWDRIDRRIPVDALASFRGAASYACNDKRMQIEAEAGIAAALLLLDRRTEAGSFLERFDKDALLLEPRARIAANSRIIEALWQLYLSDEALVRALPALKEAETSAVEFIPIFHYFIAYAYFQQDRLSDAKNWLISGMRACTTQHVRESIQMRSMLGLLRAYDGAVDEGVALIEAAFKDSAGTSFGDERALSCFRLGMIYHLTGEFDQMERWFRTALQDPAPRSKLVELRLLINFASYLSDKGHIRECLALLAAAEKLDPHWPMPVFRAYFHTILGDFGEAEAQLQVAREYSARPLMAGTALYFGGFLDEVRENTHRALDTYQMTVRYYSEHGGSEDIAANALRGIIRLGYDLKLPRPMLEDALEKFKSLPTASKRERHACEIEGYFKLACGDIRSGRDLLRKAANGSALFRKAMILLDLAAIEHGRELYYEAIQILDSLEASYSAERARGLARRAGFRPGRKREIENGFSKREWSVAELVASGRTNAEIAFVLHVSVRTAEHHITSILAKCGMRSRTEIAARIASGLPLGPPERPKL